MKQISSCCLRVSIASPPSGTDAERLWNVPSRSSSESQDFRRVRPVAPRARAAARTIRQVGAGEGAEHRAVLDRRGDRRGRRAARRADSRCGGRWREAASPSVDGGVGGSGSAAPDRCAISGRTKSDRGDEGRDRIAGQAEHDRVAEPAGHHRLAGAHRDPPEIDGAARRLRARGGRGRDRRPTRRRW